MGFSLGASSGIAALLVRFVSLGEDEDEDEAAMGCGVFSFISLLFGVFFFVGFFNFFKGLSLIVGIVATIVGIVATVIGILVGLKKLRGNKTD